MVRVWQAKPSFKMCNYCDHPSKDMWNSFSGFYLYARVCLLVLSQMQNAALFFISSLSYRVQTRGRKSCVGSKVNHVVRWKAINEQSTSSQRAVNEQSTSSQRAVNEQSTSSQRAVKQITSLECWRHFAWEEVMGNMGMTKKGDNDVICYFTSFADTLFTVASGRTSLQASIRF